MKATTLLETGPTQQHLKRRQLRSLVSKRHIALHKKKG